MTLTEFLLARIADREMLARDMQHQAATGRPLLELRGGGTLIRELVDPAHVLADCEAKRQIVERHANSGFGGCYICAEAERDDVLCVEQRILAAVHADHPDYRDEWKP